MIPETKEIEKNLGQLAMAGFGWQGLSRIGRQVVQLGISILLARLLLPSDYGLVGMVVIFVNLSLAVSDLGFTGGIVQKKEVTEDQLYSVFWLSLLVSLGIWGLAWLVAPLVAGFYKTPAIGPIFTMSILGVLLMAPSGVSRSLIYKQMQFRYSFYLDWAGMVTGGLVSIITALLKFGAWSLVLGNLTTSLTVSLIVWKFSPWRPKLIWKPKSLQGLTHFSTHYLGLQVVRNLTGSLDLLMIGKFFTATQVGLYSLAFRLVDIPRVQLGLVIQSVMYPVFIHLQEDDKRTQEILYKMSLAVSLLVFPMLTGLMVVAPNLVHVVYGSKWAESAVLLQILAWAGMASSIDQSMFVMIARGKSDWMLWMTIIRSGLLALILWLGAGMGLVVVAILVSAHAVLTTLIFQHFANRLTGFNFSQYFRSLAPAVFASGLMYLAVWEVTRLLSSSGMVLWLILGVQVVVGISVVVLALFFWPGEDVRQLVNWVQARVPILGRSRFLNNLLRYWGMLKVHKEKA